MVLLFVTGAAAGFAVAFWANPHTAFDEGTPCACVGGSAERLGVTCKGSFNEQPTPRP